MFNEILKYFEVEKKTELIAEFFAKYLMQFCKKDNGIDI